MPKTWTEAMVADAIGYVMLEHNEPGVVELDTGDDLHSDLPKGRLHFTTPDGGRFRVEVIQEGYLSE